VPAPTALKPTRTHAFSGRDVPWLLRTRAENFADSTFIAWEPFSGEPLAWTYAQFEDDVRQVSGGLYQRGIRRGDFVVIHMGNCPEFLITWFALSSLGAIAVTTNTRSTLDELHYFIDHCGAKAVVTQPAFYDLVMQAAPDLGLVACTETDLGEAVAFPSSATRFQALYQPNVVLPEQPVDSLAPNSVQYTSGTTSRPKGVLWTHANALWGAKSMARSLELQQSDVTIAFLPLFHTNALCYSMLATMFVGGKLVVQPRFSASRYWEVVNRHSVTWTAAIPFVMHALQSQQLPDSHGIRFWGLGAAEAPSAKRKFGIRTLGWYGMTETVAACLVSDMQHENIIASIGVPAPGYEIKVVDEADNEVATGDSGEIKVRAIPGISIFYEYLNNPEATAESFDDGGWFETGDIVTPLEDGSFRYEQRMKDMLKVGAENVAAAEIERAVQMAGNIREVAVVGKPDRMLDEVPVAFIIPNRGDPELADKVLSKCREMLADFKVPREIYIVDELPRVTLEKVDKKALRARLLDSA
jgi:carnitine-CoA ligase